MSEPLPIDVPPLFRGLPFTRFEAFDEGIDMAALQRLRRSGRVRRIMNAVFVDASIPDSFELRAAALAKVLPDDAVICRRTAAWLYGVDTLALAERATLPPLEYVRPPRSRATRKAGTEGHSQTLLEGDVVEVGGLRATSPAATAVHLARHLHRPFALSALDAMARAGVVSVYDVRDAVRRYRHHPHIVQARELARLMDPRAESPGESWLRLRLIDAGFTRVTPQVVVPAGGHDYRVDLAFVDERLALEYDSERWHGTREQRAADLRRAREIEATGWTVLSVGRGQVWGRNPELERAVGEILEIQPRVPRRW